MNLLTTFVFFGAFIAIYSALRYNAFKTIVQYSKRVFLPAKLFGALPIKQAKWLYKRTTDQTVKLKLLLCIYQLRLAKLTLAIGIINVSIYLVYKIVQHI